MDKERTGLGTVTLMKKTKPPRRKQSVHVLPHPKLERLLLKIKDYLVIKKEYVELPPTPLKYLGNTIIAFIVTGKIWMSKLEKLYLESHELYQKGMKTEVYDCLNV